MRFLALLFPGVTQLDLTGPAQFFSSMPGASVDLVWKTRAPVPTDAGFSIVPTVDFAEAPQADVLMVPGGPGVFEMLDDTETLDLVRTQGAQLGFEYDPHPPFDAGHPTSAGADQDQVSRTLTLRRETREPIVRRAAERVHAAGW